MKVIIGLGNPGTKYEGTRHNIGFEVIDYLSTTLNIPLSSSKFNAIYGSGNVQEEKVLLVKPSTYMNLSGEAVKPLMQFYKVDISDIIVIYDDLDLPVGKIRLRTKGSAGGHNGVKSIIQHLGTEQFNRLRIGIDRPPKGWEVINYVLGRFTEEEQQIMEETVKKASEACQEWFAKPFLEVMNLYNK